MESRLQARICAGGRLRALAAGVLVLAGCGTPRVVTPSGNARAEAAPTQDCSDRALCRDTLRRLHEVPVTSQCELRERAELARAACAQGVGEGCTELGRMALAGLGEQAQPDPGAARDWFRRACEQGDGEGCARHALSTLLGQGGLPDEASGRAELRDACDRYPRDACGLAALGLSEEARQRGGSPESEWIALLAQRGCDAGDGHSCELVGDAYRAGAGVSQDPRKAFAFYARACDEGSGTACASQGVLSLQSGAGGGEATTRADDLFSRGCALGSSEACRLLVIETREHGDQVKEDPAQEALFRQACDRGAGMGCLALYDALRHKPSDAGTSLEMPGLLKRACRLGETQACAFLEDVSRVAWQQCEAGAAPACGVLGALLLSPPSTGSETTKGLRLLGQACQEGDAASCRLARGMALRLSALTCRSD